MSNEATYVIIDIKDITDSMLIESYNGLCDLRQSLDATRSILKFKTQNPDNVSGLLKYTYEEINQYLAINAASWIVVV